jgi:hypothetical protein
LCPTISPGIHRPPIRHTAAASTVIRDVEAAGFTVCATLIRSPVALYGVGPDTGIVVDVDDVRARGGRVRVLPAKGPQPTVLLTVEISGDASGGNLVAQPPRRTILQWLRRQPIRYPELTA